MSSAQENLKGSLWMLAAMLGFAIEDSLFKATAKMLPIAQVMILFGAIGALIFATLVRRQGHSVFVPEVLSKPMLWRVLFETTGRLFFFLSLALSTLSSTTVILQATPIVVVAGAALFLGESVGWRRWVAIFIGLFGVLIVLQPGAENFSPLSILGVIGMLGFASRDLASRAAPKSLSTAVLGFYGFLAIILAGTLYGFWSGTPLESASLPALGLTVLTAVSGVLAYSALMKAMRTGDVAAVAPFRYSRLLIGVAIGVLWFGETLTLNMLIGSAVILFAGFFLLWRGRQPRAARSGL